MARTSISAYVCGTCFDLRDAHYEPTACFQCGANFEAGAPIALGLLDVAIDGERLLPAEQRVEFRGRWTMEGRSFAMLRFMVGLEEDDAPGRANARKT